MIELDSGGERKDDELAAEIIILIGIHFNLR